MGFKRYDKRKYTREQAYAAFNAFAAKENRGNPEVKLYSRGQWETPKTYEFHYMYA